jgi:hypothetical protein
MAIGLRSMRLRKEAGHHIDSKRLVPLWPDIFASLVEAVRISAGGYSHRSALTFLDRSGPNFQRPEGRNGWTADQPHRLPSETAGFPDAPQCLGLVMPVRTDMVEQPELATVPVDERARRVAEESAALLSAVSAGRLDTVQERVAFILNRYPGARDSDITLQLR